jgi:SOS-response transcriptional repressor LexA
VSDLTDRQREVHAFIVRYGREHSRWPTIRDIGDHFGINVNAVVGHLKALQREGYIERPHDGTSRGVRVLKGVDGEPVGSVCPHCGGKL